MRYPASPTGTETLNSLFEAPGNWGENFGQRLHGYFIAPLTGSYTFYIASDDSSELWLSTRANPSNASKIASVSGYCGSREWSKYPSQKSVPITLNAGNRYYISALHKEGGGGDNLAVGVDMPEGYSEYPTAGHRVDRFDKNNLPPTVSAGNDQSVLFQTSLQLVGSVTDDAAPGAVLTQAWSKVSGPGTVTFSTPNATGTSAQFSTSGSYTLRLTASDGVQQDSDDMMVTVASLNGPGTGITREWWTGITGIDVSNLKADARYPASPSGTEILTDLFETTSNWNNHFGQRLHGFFIAPLTGAYTFYIASDDSSELWLSTNGNPSYAAKIASVSGYCNSREWTKYPTQKSVPITLTAGTRYYISALHKEGGQGDNLAVGVDMPGGYSEKPIAGHRLDPAKPNIDGFFGSVWRGSSASASDPLFGTVFNQMTPEKDGKWGPAEPTQGNFNWASQDSMYALGASKNLVIKHHVFVWGQQQPTWVNDSNAQTAVTNWMTAYMQRYGDKMQIVDVVNEALSWHAPAGYKNGLGGDGATGYDWVIWSFQKAHDISKIYAPNTHFILNDYFILSDEYAMTEYLKLCNLLKDRGLLDGIGEQAHFYETHNINQLRRNLDRLGALGLPLYITEFDLDIADDAQHAARFQQLFSMFWEHARMRGITLWGHQQGQMWRTNGYLVRSDGSDRPAMTWLRGYLAANPLPGKGNLSPTVSAGDDKSVAMLANLQLSGFITDDAAPGAVLTPTWSKVSGPGTVSFSTPNETGTSAQFSASGSYTLRLTASDGVQQASDDLVVTVTLPSGPGTGIIREWWTGINGVDVSNLTSDARYPASPSGTETLTNLFESPSNWAENFGQRIHGYFIAPLTGSYAFYIASDDSSELWLSTNANPSNAIKVARVDGNTGGREWAKYASQKSAPISLTAGLRYYISALHKEGGGGDNLAVGVDLPGGYSEKPIAGHRLDPRISSDADDDSLADTWEMTHFGNLDQTAGDDFEKDGTNNLTEFRLGLNPKNSISRFAAVHGGGGLIQWPSVIGVTFRIMRNTTLAADSWIVLEAAFPGTAGTASYTDPSPPAGNAF